MQVYVQKNAGTSYPFDAPSRWKEGEWLLLQVGSDREAIGDAKLAQMKNADQPQKCSKKTGYRDENSRRVAPSFDLRNGAPVRRL